LIYYLLIVNWSIGLLAFSKGINTYRSTLLKLNFTQKLLLYQIEIDLDYQKQFCIFWISGIIHIRLHIFLENAHSIIIINIRYPNRFSYETLKAHVKKPWKPEMNDLKTAQVFLNNFYSHIQIFTIILTVLRV